MPSIARRRVAVAAAIVAGAVGLGACRAAPTDHDAATPIPTSTSTTTAPSPLARPYKFVHTHVVLVDHTRSAGTKGQPGYTPVRTLPTEIYTPVAPDRRPLIVFAHGYHGAPRKFTQLFSAWAAAGYVVVAPQFPLTSTRPAPFDQVADYVNQPADISFVLDHVLASPLAAKIDASRIGAAGLSLGGGTVYGLVYNPCCIDKRIKAAAIFDSERFPFARPFGKNAVPVLIMHIDSDLALPYAKARQSFLDSASPKFFTTFHGGIHPEPYEDEPSPHDVTARKVSIDFWDLTLLGDTAARGRILHDGNVKGESKTIAG
jgi:dienelactone hydrolase